MKLKKKTGLQKLREYAAIPLEIDVNGRAITYKLAEYLQELFPDFNVDCEYNRFEELKKKLDLPKNVPNLDDKVSMGDLEARTVYPDIIIHKECQRRIYL